MNRTSDIQVLSVLGSLLALALLLGIADQYVVGAGFLLLDVRLGAFFLLSNPNLVVLGVILFALVGALAFQVMADATARRRPWWFTAMLMLTATLALVLVLFLFLPRPLETQLDPSGTGYPIVVGCGGVPLLIALTGLLYVFKYTFPAAYPATAEQVADDAVGDARAERVAALRRVVHALAVMTLLLIGLPGLLNLLLALVMVATVGLSEMPIGSTSVGYYADQALWQALQAVFIVAVGILSLLDVARSPHRLWLVRLLLPMMLGMLLVSATGILTTLNVVHAIVVPWQPIYVAGALAPVVATLLVPLPALIYARRTAPRAEAPPTDSSPAFREPRQP